MGAVTFIVAVGTVGVGVYFFSKWLRQFFYMPAGYTLKRVPYRYSIVYGSGYEVLLVDSAGIELDFFPECIYGARGAVTSAREQAHKYARNERITRSGAYAKEFERKYGEK